MLTWIASACTGGVAVCMTLLALIVRREDRRDDGGEDGERRGKRGGK